MATLASNSCSPWLSLRALAPLACPMLPRHTDATSNLRFFTHILAIFSQTDSLKKIIFHIAEANFLIQYKIYPKILDCYLFFDSIITLMWFQNYFNNNLMPGATKARVLQVGFGQANFWLFCYWTVVITMNLMQNRPTHSFSVKLYFFGFYKTNFILRDIAVCDHVRYFLNCYMSYWLQFEVQCHACVCRGYLFISLIALKASSMFPIVR